MAWRSPVPRAVRLLPRALRDRVVRARTRVRERELAAVTVTLAESAADLRAAARLVHDAYVARGFMSPEPSGARLTPHQLLPTTALLDRAATAVPAGEPFSYSGYSTEQSPMGPAPLLTGPSQPDKPHWYQTWSVGDWMQARGATERPSAADSHQP
jgi:hypothetical protein